MLIWKHVVDFLLVLIAHELFLLGVTARACERSVSGAKNGAERPENRVERSGAERSGEREIAERERSVERAELAAHSPLQRNISLIS